MSELNPIGSNLICAAIHLAADMIGVSQDEWLATHKRQLDHVLDRYGIEGKDGEGAVTDIANRLMTFAKRIAESKNG